VPKKARGSDVRPLEPPLPVRSWVQFPSRLHRVEGRALAMTPDAVLVEWGERTTHQSAWLWRRAVRHRTVPTGLPLREPDCDPPVRVRADQGGLS
jgi:hypothetical protein